MKTLARPANTAEIVRRLKLVRPDSARRWGRMSAHQMVQEPALRRVGIAAVVRWVSDSR